MKKAIGLAFLTMILMAGTVTAYAATGSAAVGPGCGQGSYCEEYECMRDGVCTVSDCEYHSTTTYDGNGCRLDHTHNSNCSGTQSGHHGGRGHHGRGHC